MREIILNMVRCQYPNYRKYIALIDDADFEVINKHNWYVAKRCNTFYAITNMNDKKVYMHRFLTGFNKTDHKDNNGLNNQRSNLRECTDQQNQMNKRKQKKHTSRYKGVSWYKNYKKWQANIHLNNKNINLGYFLYEHNAAHAYNFKAIELFGEYAKLNQISI